ncbi:bifunctional folylpolyglutamate synthase/dihydrofolate synthase [Riemerella columbina]|uniref:bifunctional folylpolyglutamate synthase/dihydrofolate synthase n=1 Tax=Riemerella columbina TaxID=103810 RepID=UPI00266FF07C|nr:folylpolyglutamate synthase/dihydrofolate synthase family protein [Riemerella columbina]WKS96085.1 bifunctional folylpolyglutamate synthase/dihydrofolate synthase [Riemerella columbina]
MMEKRYQQALEWLYAQMPNYQINGKKAYKPGLENIKKLCDFFGNPQEGIPMVHIGGTNGKGSTSNMLASVLQEAGYRVGLYNSPHLVNFTERIKINGVEADPAFVLDFIERLKHLPSEIKPSFFEFTTVMAFEYFKRQQVDIAMIEVGLGGRLDATNIIQPVLTALTNVALDHQDILGETIEAIAVEKAGIIKPHIPIISGEEQADIKTIFKTKAEALQAPFIDATQIDTIHFSSDLQGDYQRKNIKVVLAAVAELKRQGFTISEEHIARGLSHVQRNTGFLGRWFQFSDAPLTICDTGHNQAGLEAVLVQLSRYEENKHIVLGFVKDKKIESIIAFLPQSADYYFVKPQIERGQSPKNYEESLKKSGLRYKIFDSVEEGYQSAKSHCKADEMIFIGGSNFVVGEFLEKNLSVYK